MKTIKRILFSCFVLCGLLVSQGASAQVFYRCTGDNVNVRTGPGKNYAVLSDDCFLMYVQLEKGETVRSRGAALNGFIPVTCIAVSTASGAFPVKGWVSAQYLKRMVKCTQCNGRGFFNRPCRDFDGSPEFHPSACLCSSSRCLHCGDCYRKQHCHSCNGVGYK